MSAGTATDQAALQLRQVTKRFGDLAAVDRVDLTVGRGELVTLLGPSGSGKSTLLRLVAGFEVADEGSIEIDGVAAGAMSPAERGIGMVFQQYALFPQMTAAENIAYGLKVRGWDSARKAKRVAEMLAIVDLEEFAERRPGQLSGGQQQRVALARALAFEPAILLMDEPLGALDRELRMQMVEEIRRLHRELGVTAVYVTHDQEEALAVSDRVALMRGGDLVALGEPRSLYERPQTVFSAQFLARANLLEVEVESVAGESAAVRWHDGQLIELPAAAALAPGGARAAIAPYALRAAPGPGCLALELLVEDVVFLGEVSQVSGSSPRFGPLVARLPNDQAAALELGRPATLYAPAAAITVVPAEGPR